MANSYTTPDEKKKYESYYLGRAAQGIGKFLHSGAAGMSAPDLPYDDDAGDYEEPKEDRWLRKTGAASVEEARRELIAKGNYIPTDRSGANGASTAQNATAQTAAPQSNVRSWSWGESGQPGSGTATYHGRTLPAPGSNFRNFGYDPAEARTYQQAQAPYQQIAPGTYQGRGFTFQGNAGDAARFFQATRPSEYRPSAYIPGEDNRIVRYFQEGDRPSSWSPIYKDVYLPKAPEAPKGGWQTARAVYDRQMDAYNQAQNRDQAMQIAQMQDARAAQRFGFDQEQARQAMDLQRAQLGLQADQNVWNRAKTLADMEQAAVGTQLQQIQLGAQQDYLRAVQSGDAAAIARAEAALRALNPKGRGGRADKDAGGTKVHNIKIGDTEMAVVQDQDGNYRPVMPRGLMFVYQNWENLTPEQKQLEIGQLAALGESMLAKAEAANAADEEAKKKK